MSSEEMIEQSGNPAGDPNKSPGERLQEAREMAGLSRTEVADRLKIPESYVIAIEESQFDQMPAELVFVRGYVRSYAGFLALPGDELVEAFDRFTGDTVEAAPLKDGRPIEVRRQVSPLLSWGGTLAAILLIGVVSFYSWNSGQQVEAPDPITILETPEDLETTTVEQDDGVVLSIESSPATEPTTGSEEAEDEPQPEALDSEDSLQEPEGVQVLVEDVEALSEVVVEPVEDISSEVRLLVSFIEDCWVQVWDSEGNTLFAGVQVAGSELDMEVPGSVEIRLGNVNGVDQLSFDGRLIDVEPSGPGRRVASLELEAVEA